MSDRALRVFDLIKNRPGISSKEIEDAACVCSARDWIRRIRDAGHTITMSERQENGSRVCRWTYQQPVAVEGRLF